MSRAEKNRRLDAIFDHLFDGNCDVVEQMVEAELKRQNELKSQRSVEKVIEVLGCPPRPWVDLLKPTQAFDQDDILGRDIMMVLNEKFVADLKKKSKKRADFNLIWLQVKSSTTGVLAFKKRLTDKGIDWIEYLNRNRLILINGNPGGTYQEGKILGRVARNLGSIVYSLSGLEWNKYLEVLAEFDEEAAAWAEEMK